MSFSQAVSGLNAAAANLDTIGNNISNSATYGFKGATVSFADVFCRLWCRAWCKSIRH
ncbi:flagellar hook protein FlgE [Proteus mirabilis]|uniref:Flagellar hook protein FlgE n=1 Tax=Proteus mirabilis TaxID=584 RepID=A0A379GGJ4_PROMI|nr:flagellar hook protein FlgE [Proteus mirabilis]